MKRPNPWRLLCSTIFLISSFIISSCDMGSLEQLFEEVTTTITGVTISPYSYTITPGNSLSLSATVEGNNNPSQLVTWSINGASSPNTVISEAGVLSIDASEKEGSFTVTATSKTNSAISGSAHITIAVPTVTSVSITPQSTSMSLNSSLQFTAKVEGTNYPSQDVIWSLTGANSKASDITSSGVLTIASDETSASLTLTVTSQFDTTKSAQATISILPYTITSVTATPSSVALKPGESQIFSATVDGKDGLSAYPKTVTWSIENNKSSSTMIDAATGTLTIGLDETSSSIKVKVISTGDPNKYCEINTTILIPVATVVTVSPSSASVDAGYAQTFSALVTGNYSPAQTVTWSVSGNENEKTKIDSAGVLTVADFETATSLVVTATSTVTPTVSGKVTITVVPDATYDGCTGTPLAISVTPKYSFLYTENTQQFSAIVTGTGNVSQRVKWSVSGNTSSATTIDKNGLLTIAYDEGNIANGVTEALIVTATSKADNSITGTAGVGLTVPTVTKVSVSPATATVRTNRTKQFSATVSGTGLPSQKVLWSVSGNIDAATTIDESGLLSISKFETAPSLTITATSARDTSFSANTTVTVTFPVVTSLTITPAATEDLSRGDTLQFTAQATGTDEPESDVTWSVSDNTSANTTITADGLLSIATDEGDSTVGNSDSITVTATSKITPSISQTYLVTVLVPYATGLTLSAASSDALNRNGTLQLNQTVTGDNNPSQTCLWTISGNTSSSTTISSSGLLTIGADEGDSTLLKTTETLTITATSAITPTVSKTYTVTVNVPTVTGIVVTDTTAGSYVRGSTVQLSAAVTAVNGMSTDVTWSVENKTSSSTTIDANGLLTLGSDEGDSNVAEDVYVTVVATSKGAATATGSLIVALKIPYVSKVRILRQNLIIAKGGESQPLAYVGYNSLCSAAQKKITWSIEPPYYTDATFKEGTYYDEEDNSLAVALDEELTYFTLKASSNLTNTAYDEVIVSVYDYIKEVTMDTYDDILEDCHESDSVYVIFSAATITEAQILGVRDFLIEDANDNMHSLSVYLDFSKCSCETFPEYAMVQYTNGTYTPCNDVYGISLPLNCKKIGTYAFYDCGNLKDFRMFSEIESVGKYAFYNTSITAFCFKTKKDLTLTVNDNAVWSKIDYDVFYAEDCKKTLTSNSFTTDPNSDATITYYYPQQ